MSQNNILNYFTAQKMERNNLETIKEESEDAAELRNKDDLVDDDDEDDDDTETDDDEDVYDDDAAQADQAAAAANDRSDVDEENALQAAVNYEMFGNNNIANESKKKMKQIDLNVFNKNEKVSNFIETCPDYKAEKLLVNVDLNKVNETTLNEEIKKEKTAVKQRGRKRNIEKTEEEKIFAAKRKKIREALCGLEPVITLYPEANFKIIFDRKNKKE